MPESVPPTADVLVIGAGPAGSAAAIVLARAGRSVVMVDKAGFPRDKCCGDGLTTLALRETVLLGLRPEHVPNWQTVHDVWLRSPNGREVHLPMPGGGAFAATTPRRELDDALVGLAKGAGADLHEACTLVSLDVDELAADPGRRAIAVVETGDGTRHEIGARHVIAADGMWSASRRLLGLGGDGYMGEWHAFRQYVSGVTGPAADRLYVWFDDDLLPGYAWSFPLPGGRANVGFGVLRDGERNGRQMKDLWAGLLDRPHIRAALGPDVEPEGRHTAWPIPAGIDKATLTHGPVLFVGDAARATDVMTGEGIGQALLTGRLAAEAVLGAPSGDVRAVAERYSRTVRSHLLADHRMSLVLGRALARPWVARGAVRLVGLTPWTRRHFVRWMFEDEHRAVIATPRRWHRQFLRRPAPYPDPS